MIQHEYGNIGDRNSALTYLSNQNFNRIVDVGASYNLWAGMHVSHIVDLNKVSDNRYTKFTGNMCEDEVWNYVSFDCNLHGKFDFSICTHTLEDILHPVYVIKQLCKFSKEGYIAVPSKWVELTKSHSRDWKGWMHHRWLFDVIDDTLVCVPKLPYLEYINTDSFKGRPEELRFFWKDTISVKILNNDFIGPSEDAYMQLVYEFLGAN